MPKRKKENRCSNTKVSKRSSTCVSSVCICENKKLEITWNPRCLKTHNNHVVYKSWILNRDISFYLNLPDTLHNVLYEIQYLVDTKGKNSCKSITLLQKELELLQTCRLGILVHEEWQWGKGDIKYRTFVCGKNLFESVEQKDLVEKTRIFDELFQKEGSAGKPSALDAHCFQNGCCRFLFLSPFIFLDWNIRWERQKTNYFPYNLYNPIPIRAPLLKLIGVTEQKSDLRYREIMRHKENPIVDYKPILHAILLNFVALDMVSIILDYVTSNLVSYLQDQIADWRLFPHYASIDKMRYIDVNKINGPTDVLDQYDGCVSVDLLSCSTSVPQHLTPFTFCLKLNVLVPDMYFKGADKWTEDFTLEEFLIWNTLYLLCQHGYLPDCNINDGIRMNKKWIQLYDTKEVNFNSLVEWFKNYVRSLPPYEIQQIDGTHKSVILAPFCQVMKPARRFPSSGIYDCTASDWLLENITFCCCAFSDRTASSEAAFASMLAFPPKT